MGLERRGGLVRWDYDGQPVTGKNRRDLTTDSRSVQGERSRMKREFHVRF